MIRTSCLVLALLAALACGNGAGAGPDSGLDVDLDKTSDGSPVGCPADRAAAEGTTCGAAAMVCGAEACSTCGACSVLRCIAGTWRRVESGAVSRCEGDGTSHDTIGGDSIGQVCDAIGNADGYNPPCGGDPAAEPMVPVACWDNAMDVRDHPCTSEGATCGLEDCADPCARCNFTSCRQGMWTYQVVPPAPTCYPTDAEVASDPVCTTWGCGPTQVCGTPCPVDCGCCACAPGERYCGSVEGATPGSHVAGMYECNGTCYEPIACPEGDACVDGASLGVSCLTEIETCGEIEALFAALIERAQLCWGQCGAAPVPCVPGSTNGWLAVVRDDFPGPASIDLGDLMARYVELGCATGECERATLMPEARCVGGVCTLVE